jgi:hypothetical protein
MGESKIKFGDKIFLYGSLLNEYAPTFEGFQYNSIMGYMTIGGYDVTAVESDNPFASLPGFLVDVPFTPHFAVATPFSQMEAVDVTGKLALSLPLPSGTKVWLPTRLLD